MTESEEEILTPRPGALIESLRSFGYTPAASVADLIDNSLSAGATRVAVTFYWDGPESAMTIVDNGTGMHESDLREAMRAGSANPLGARSPTDLGRFGLGLKTASFAQARSLTVVSQRDEAVSIRRWDLDHVQKENRWALLKTPPPNGQDLAERLNAENGTVVAWHSMDRLTDDRPSTDEAARRAFERSIDEVHSHLEMVFHRFISEDGLELSVNGRPCRAWDPFLGGHPGTELRQDESLPVTFPDGNVQKLVVQPYILPHRSRLSADEHRTAAGPRGWNLQQGFYLYRARRLIVPGDWFEPDLKPEEHFKLARIRVEITQEMDSMWALDVRKSRARPPSALRREFQRIARASRSYASEVYRSRGRREVGQSQRGPSEPVWRAETDGKVITYAVNRAHPVIERMMTVLGPIQQRELRSLLSIVERTVPIDHILSIGYGDEGKLDVAPPSVGNARAAGKSLFCHFLQQGLSGDEARAQLDNIQPFDQMPGLVNALEESDCT